MIAGSRQPSQVSSVGQLLAAGEVARQLGVPRSRRGRVGRRRPAVVAGVESPPGSMQPAGTPSGAAACAQAAVLRRCALDEPVGDVAAVTAALDGQAVRTVAGGVLRVGIAVAGLLSALHAVSTAGKGRGKASTVKSMPSMKLSASSPALVLPFVAVAAEQTEVPVEGSLHPARRRR